MTLRIALDRALEWQSAPTQRPQFSFRWSMVAAAKNLAILKSYQFDLQQALAA